MKKKENKTEKTKIFMLPIFIKESFYTEDITTECKYDVSYFGESNAKIDGCVKKHFCIGVSFCCWWFQVFYHSFKLIIFNVS